MDSIKKVNTVCKSVLKLTDEDFEAVSDMQRQQSGYSHPLKMGKAAKFHDIGDHNANVIAALRNLRDVIKAGER